MKMGWRFFKYINPTGCDHSDAPSESSSGTATCGERSNASSSGMLSDTCSLFSTIWYTGAEIAPTYICKRAWLLLPCP